MRNRQRSPLPDLVEEFLGKCRSAQGIDQNHPRG
jgi:hypothetical protein